MKTAVTSLLLLFVWIPAVFCASLNFQASDQYVIKGEDEVVFTLTYDPKGGEPADSLKIQLNSDQGTLYSETFTDLPGGTFTKKHAAVFDKPGYFDVEARFTTKSEGTDGNIQTDSEELGPVTINVANWKFTAEGSLGCIEAAPLVAENGETVFVGAEDGNLYAVNTLDGTEKWRFNAGGQIHSAPSLGPDGNIFFSSSNGRVYCVEPEAGALAWQFPAGGEGAKGPFYASPALDKEKNRLYIGSTDHNLYALDMNAGTLQWRFQTGAKIVSSAAIGHDHTIYQGSLDEFLYAVNPDGTKKWRFDAAYRIRSSPALDADGTIFVGTCAGRGEANENNGLHAITSTGREKWFVGKINGFPAAPVIAEKGTIIIGSYDNTLYAISRKGGGLDMYKNFADDVLGSPALDNRGRLYAGGREGTFYALDPNEGNPREGRDEYWRYRFPMELTGSSPVVQNGYVYIGACNYQRGALYSLICSESGRQTAGPAEDAPWPQARNDSANTGKTRYTPETIAPAVASTNPDPGIEDLDTSRDSISVTFTMPMEPSSIYQPPDPENEFEGYFGFTVEPFDAPDEDFDVTWNDAKTRFTLSLPEGAAFEKDTTYTATILKKARAASDSNGSILYTYDWSFSNTTEEGPSNDHDAWSCFIDVLGD